MHITHTYVLNAHIIKITIIKIISNFATNFLKDYSTSIVNELK